MTSMETISSDSYVLGIIKKEIPRSLYLLFYNRVNSLVKPSNASTKWIFPAWPDKDIENASSYPICIINSPEGGNKKLTQTRKQVNFTIDITVYVSNQKDLDNISGEVLDAVEVSYPYFKKLNIHHVNWEGSSTDHKKMDKITVHSKTMSFSGNWAFNRTM